MRHHQTPVNVARRCASPRRSYVLDAPAADTVAASAASEPARQNTSGALGGRRQFLLKVDRHPLGDHVPGC
jgi:hypothetical protein